MPEPEFCWPNYFTGYGTYLDSIRRLAALDAEVLCLSHNAVIREAADVKEYFGKVTVATEAYHRRIVDAVKGGAACRALAEELGTEAHGKIGLLPPEFFQKNCALLVKQSLRHEGIEEKPS
jgi:hypothetical protein